MAGAHYKFEAAEGGPSSTFKDWKKNHKQKTFAFYLALSFLEEAISWNEQEEEFIPSERTEITILLTGKEGAFNLLRTAKESSNYAGQVYARRTFSNAL